MFVSRQESGYSFCMALREEPFEIGLWLGDDGAEKLSLSTRSTDQSWPSMPLEQGSIRSMVGDKRWSDFLRLRAAGHDKMYLPPGE